MKFREKFLNLSAGSRAPETLRIETLRGLACILLVSFHVIGSDPAAGLKVEDDSYFRVLSDLIVHLRMPLFAFLSGFVYAFRPARAGAYKPFVAKKVKRLLLPMVTVATVFFGVQHLTPGASSSSQWSDLPKIYILPYAHFWYLQASFLIFALVGALDTFIDSRWRIIQAAIFFFSVVLQIYLLDISSFFSLNQAFFLLPYFLAGVYTKRMKLLGCPPLALQRATAVIFLITFSIHSLGCFGILGQPLTSNTFLSALLSLSAMLLLSWWTPHFRFLARIGSFSFTIYLYHVFFTAAARIILLTFGVTSDLQLFVIGCIAGIAGPIVVDRILSISRWTSLIFLGRTGEATRSSHTHQRSTDCCPPKSAANN